MDESSANYLNKAMNDQGTAQPTDSYAFDSAPGLATTSGPGGPGITGTTVAGPDITSDIVGNLPEVDDTGEEPDNSGDYQLTDR